MSSSELPEYAVREPRALDDDQRRVLARPRPPCLAGGGDHVGPVGSARARAERAARRRREGRRRARLRHRLLLRLAGPSGRAAGRRRRHARAARDGPAPAGGDRYRVPAARGERGGGSAAGRFVRPRPSRSTAPRSGATPTAGSRRRHGCSGRAASSSSCATRRSPCSVRRSTAGTRRCSGRSVGSTGSTGRTTGRRVPPAARRALSRCCERPASTFSTSRSSTRPTTPRRPSTTTRIRIGGSWPGEEIWRARRR